jgi:hypothetical protein
MEKMTDLSRRSQLFVQAYLETWNATAAAREIGSRDPARTGMRMLRRPEIQAAIEVAVKAAGMGNDEVLTRLTQQARLNASTFFLFENTPVRDEDGNPVLENGEPLTRRVMTGINWAMVEKYGYLIKRVSYNRQGKPVLEFHDPQKALELIGRAQQLFVEKSEINLKVEESHVRDRLMADLAGTVAENATLTQEKSGQ